MSSDAVHAHCAHTLQPRMQSYVAQGLLVECSLAEMSFDDLESMGSGVSLLLQPSDKMYELSMLSKSFSSIVDVPL